MSDDAFTYLTIIGPETAMQSVDKDVSIDGVKVSRPQPTAAMSDAVDAPLGPEEIKLLMEFATVSLTLGAAAIEFIGALKDILTKSDEADQPRIIVLDARTNIELVSIYADTDPAAALRKIEDATKS